MSYKGLIVDDDVDIRRIACSVMDSLGHEHVEAGSQETARKRVEGVDYVLLDLELPEKESRGFPRVQNGLNYLEELVSSPRSAHIPVIVMTAHGKGDPSLAVEVLTAGAANWINKPFPQLGRTLDKVIKETLAKKPPKASAASKSREKSASRAFEGGELVFLPDSVTLCGIRVAASSTLMGQILQHLQSKNSHGRYRSFSYDELAAAVQCTSGQNTITGTVSDFRRKASQLLLDHAGLVCGDEDIIETVNGVRFKEWITLASSTPTTPQASSTPQPPGKVSAAKRQEWVLEQLKLGVQLRVADIVKACKCSGRTVLRDMEQLRQQGRVKFYGEPKTGYYGLSQ